MIRTVYKRFITTKAEPLVSEPFKVANARKLRDTNQVFPRPNFISFDAYGTLYTPKSPIYDQYFEIASKEFGIDKSRESIKQDFPKAHQQLLSEFPNYGKDSNHINTIEQWWLELIIRVFELDHYSKNKDSLNLCNRLINHFESSEAYHLFEDVIPTISKLSEHNINLVVSSNSDSRVYKILDSLGLSTYIDDSNVYLSYNLAHEKPEKTFFDMISNSQIVKAYGTLLPKQERADYLSNCWHVGDGHDKDFLGAVRSGWNGIYLDRLIQSKYLTQEMPDPDADSTSCMTKPNDSPSLGTPEKPIQLLADNRIIISDLTQLLQLFDIPNN